MQVYSIFKTNQAPVQTLELMKIRSISSIEEIDDFIASVTQSANKTLKQVSQLSLSNEGLKALWSMKTQPIGCNPLNSEDPLNLIEQLNQTFTYIASARAVRILLWKHPDLAPFTMNLGTSPGSDIESKSGGGLAAEVFAAVNTSNNRKLANDLKCAPAMMKDGRKSSNSQTLKFGRWILRCELQPGARQGLGDKTAAPVASMLNISIAAS